MGIELLFQIAGETLDPFNLPVTFVSCSVEKLFSIVSDREGSDLSAVLI